MNNTENQVNISLENRIDPYDFTATGYFSVSQSGLITNVNLSGAKLLGVEKSELIGKAFTLFVSSEDLVIFFMHRNNIFSKKEPQTCEMCLVKGDRSQINAYIEFVLIHDTEKNTDTLQMSITDITEKKQAMNALQHKQDLTNIIFSISTNLITCPQDDIDSAINHVLATIGVFSEVDRSYVCLFQKEESKVSISHEWYSEGIDTQFMAPTLFAIDEIPGILGDLESNTDIIIADMDSLLKEIATEADIFHLQGTKSVMYSPMYFGESLYGVIGLDSLAKKGNWSKDIDSLLKITGEMITNTLMRQNLEGIAFDTKKAAVIDEPVELHDVPIEEIIDKPEIAAPEKQDLRTEWVLEKGSPPDPAMALKLYPKDDNRVTIACPNCIRRKDVTLAKINELGGMLKVKCICDREFYIHLDLREAFRKRVNLEGVFTRRSYRNISYDSESDWGKIRVKDLSKTGISFIASGLHNIRRGDRLMVRFTLDNSAKTVINKKVVVRSVNGNNVGCEFVGTDKNDITIGFYLLG